MQNFTRRLTLKLMGLSSLLFGFKKQALHAQEVSSSKSNDSPHWQRLHDRVWLSGDCWANPMEDWKITDGAAECTSTGGNRNVHRLTHQITHPDQAFQMSVVIDCVEEAKNDTGAGFRIGIRSDIQEYRSNCFSNSGIEIGWVDGKLKVGSENAATKLTGGAKQLTLTLEGRPEGGRYSLKLIATDGQDAVVGEVTNIVGKDEVLGNVAIGNNFSPNNNKAAGSRYRFSEWKMVGNAFQVTPSQMFGPILWSMYSLSDSRGPEGHVLKITALTGPLGNKDNHDVELQIQRDGKWVSLGSAQLDAEAWTATHRIPNWNEKSNVPYRLRYKQFYRDGSVEDFEWTGTILANPTGRPLRIAGMTCQNDYAFPYEPVANNLIRLKPDLLYFSGDQIYESHGGFGIIRNPADRAILNYLRKFYQFGWAFREAMRNSPTICIPDDHDVFHGNLWGEGGKPATSANDSSSGGYMEPARMVNVVHKTNASHHPDYFDPTPVEQGISVYYGDMVYGGVGFAILGDRQFKSGPQSVDVGGPRPDHVVDQNFDPLKIDLPGLVLLGERQENFLKQWVEDWRGHSMKILLSQTVFAGMATHHGKYNGYLKADLDCGGWPQTPRNHAIRILSQGKVFHLNGDQHLASLIQYGVDKQRDSGWSFCTPAIAVGYPRWWRPTEMNMPFANRPKHNLSETGEYLDGLGNKMYVYAVGNPEVASKKQRYELAHQKGSGFGFVTVDTQAKTYFVECFRFLCDATDKNPGNQFPGWPVTIQQKENDGENVLG